MFWSGGENSQTEASTCSSRSNGSGGALVVEVGEDGAGEDTGRRRSEAAGAIVGGGEAEPSSFGFLLLGL